MRIIDVVAARWRQLVAEVQLQEWVQLCTCVAMAADRATVTCCSCSSPFSILVLRFMWSFWSSVSCSFSNIWCKGMNPNRISQNDICRQQVTLKQESKYTGTAYFQSLNCISPNTIAKEAIKWMQMQCTRCCCSYLLVFCNIWTYQRKRSDGSHIKGQTSKGNI